MGGCKSRRLYKTLLADTSQHLGTPASELVGGPVPEYIARKLTTKHPKRAFAEQCFATYLIADTTDQWCP